MAATIVLFHQDLRLGDHAPLLRACERGAVIPLYIHNPLREGWVPGAASRWFLREALRDLSGRLAKLGAPLILRQGGRLQTLLAVIAETGADSVTWHGRYEPAAYAEDTAMALALRQRGISVAIEPGWLLFEPAAIRTGAGKPFRVFTPFSRACFAAPPPTKPRGEPQQLLAVPAIASDTLDSLNLVPPKASWLQGLADAWDVREAAVAKQFAGFLSGKLSDYAAARDRPDAAGTSRLSPYIHYGLISPRQVWHGAMAQQAAHPQMQSSIGRFLLEVLWREFSCHLLVQAPDLAEKPLAEAFTRFPWRRDAAGLKAWQQGQTGYPIVDAGMRELWQTGWMHNRVRMITASFLIKHLLIPWQEGEAWFWDTLVDADLAANAASWQWVAGCGADAAPYFRIFNPVLQGEKFDTSGDYVHRYVPELARLPAKYIHAPWMAPASVLAEAGVELGKTYPWPVIEHVHARNRALAALASTKQEASRTLFG
jgi:Deoxyribodipyrimidine photolyase